MTASLKQWIHDAQQALRASPPAPVPELPGGGVLRGVDVLSLCTQMNPLPETVARWLIDHLASYPALKARYQATPELRKALWKSGLFDPLTADERKKPSLLLAARTVFAFGECLDQFQPAVWVQAERDGSCLGLARAFLSYMSGGVGFAQPPFRQAMHLACAAATPERSAGDVVTWAQRLQDKPQLLQDLRALDMAQSVNCGNNPAVAAIPLLNAIPVFVALQACSHSFDSTQDSIQPLQLTADTAQKFAAVSQAVRGAQLLAALVEHMHNQVSTYPNVEAMNQALATWRAEIVVNWMACVGVLPDAATVPYSGSYTGPRSLPEACLTALAPRTQWLTSYASEPWNQLLGKIFPQYTNSLMELARLAVDPQKAVVNDEQFPATDTVTDGAFLQVMALQKRVHGQLCKNLGEQVFAAVEHASLQLPKPEELLTALDKDVIAACSQGKELVPVPVPDSSSLESLKTLKTATLPALWAQVSKWAPILFTDAKQQWQASMRVMSHHPNFKREAELLTLSPVELLLRSWTAPGAANILKQCNSAFAQLQPSRAQQTTFAKKMPTDMQACWLAVLKNQEQFRALVDRISQLPSEERARLPWAEFLAAKNSRGFPGLYFALANGHTDTVRAFGALLQWVPKAQRARLPWAKLLAAKGSNGTPWLYFALANGHTDTVNAFGELLQWVPQAQHANFPWADLLAAKNSDGTPWLHSALQNGYADTVLAFNELLRWVPQAQRAGLPWAELLAAKNSQGIPGLYYALARGHTDTVRAFGQLLQQVPLAQRADFPWADLLAAKNRWGTQGLHFALENGDANTVLAFGELLQQVPKAQRAGLNWARLLTAKPYCHAPGGLHVALKNGHTDTVLAVGELLQPFANQPEHHNALIQALNTKFKKGNQRGFGLALAQKPEVATAYKAIISDLVRAGVPPDKFKPLFAGGYEEHFEEACVLPFIAALLDPLDPLAPQNKSLLDALRQLNQASLQAMQVLEKLVAPLVGRLKNAAHLDGTLQQLEEIASAFAPECQALEKKLLMRVLAGDKEGPGLMRHYIQEKNPDALAQLGSFLVQCVKNQQLSHEPVLAILRDKGSNRLITAAHQSQNTHVIDALNQIGRDLTAAGVPPADVTLALLVKEKNRLPTYRDVMAAPPKPGTDGPSRLGQTGTSR